MYYAALHSVSAAPRGCVWFQQIRIPWAWIRAFLNEIDGNLERIFDLDAYLRRGLKTEITTDASPYGIGAVPQWTALLCHTLQVR